jgi:AraC-like DNA-binding protein
MKQLILFGGIQGLVISAALLRMKSPLNKVGNIFFGLLIVSVSLYLIINSQTQYYPVYPKIFIGSYLLIYLIFPFYYLHTRSLVNEKSVWSNTHLLYFIPAFLYCILMIWVIILPNKSLRPNSLVFFSFYLADFLSIIFNYLLILKSWRLLKYREREPAIENTGLDILKTFQVTMIICNTTWLYFVLTKSIVGLPDLPFGIDLVYISMSFLIYFLAYALISRNHLFSKSVSTVQKTYQNVSFDDQQLDLIANDIVRKIKETKAYRDPNFSLEKLSQLTGRDKFKLSYTISKKLNSSFTTIINELRINDFIVLYEGDNYKHYTLLGIANEVGFKTKSTFYKAFKEFKGVTPLQFFEENSKNTLIKKPYSLEANS